MSYDISLYQKSFLKRAVEEDLGDWSNADPFENSVRGSINAQLLEEGYVMRAESASMTELTHPNDQWGLQVCVFSGEVTFTIPYWDDFDSALAEAQRTATKIAEQFDLGCYDPQDGSANY